MDQFACIRPRCCLNYSKTPTNCTRSRRSVKKRLGRSTYPSVSTGSQAIVKLEASSDENTLSAQGPLSNTLFRAAQTWLDIIEVESNAPQGGGTIVAVIDNGISLDHPDLRGRVKTDREDSNQQTYAQAAGQPNPNWLGWPNEFSTERKVGSKLQQVNEITYPHGTAVAGIIGASGETFVRGVAPEVQLLDCNCANAQNFYIYTKLNWGIEFVDIYNNSWGPQFLPATCPTTCQEMEDGTIRGRSGKGCLYVWSAGNSYEVGGNSNLEAALNLYSTIVVAARNIVNSTKSSYSTLGANVLVSGIGARDGPDPTGVITTGPYPQIMVNLGMNGTSAAAPMVSGVIAVLLAEATATNKALSWSDVKEILCSCAQPSLLGEMRSIGPFKSDADAKTDVMNVRKQDLIRRVPQKSGQERFFSPQYGYGTVSLRKALEVLGSYKLPISRGFYTFPAPTPIATKTYPVSIARSSVEQSPTYTDIDYLDFIKNAIATFGDPLKTPGPDPSFQATIEEVNVSIYGVGGLEGIELDDVTTLEKLGICLVLGQLDGGPPTKPVIFQSSWILSCSEQRGVGSEALLLPPSKRLNVDFKSEAFRGYAHTGRQIWGLYAGLFNYPGTIPNIVVEGCSISIRYRVDHPP